MLFREIIGLTDIKQSLIQAVSRNHVAHAQLFHGGEGSANLAMALAYATYINCEAKQPNDACGKCSNCLKMIKLAHPDVYYIFPTAGGKSVVSENFMPQWRTFLKENPYQTIANWLEHISIKQGNIPVEESRLLLQKLSLKSYQGGYKIALIWQAEMLNTAAGNALLKILEEPPEQTLFLLVANNSDKLLTTIISRTQRIAIRNFSDDEIVAYLTQKQAVSIERAKEIAYLSNGKLNQALEIIAKNDFTQHTWFATWMRMCYAVSILKLVPMAEEFDAKGKEYQKAMLGYGLYIFREIFLCRSGGESLIRLEGEELIFVQKFSNIFNINNLEAIMNLLDEAFFHIERNGRAKIIFLDISLTIARLMR